MKEIRLLYPDNQVDFIQDLLQKLGFNSMISENTDWHRQVLMDRIQAELDNSLLTEENDFKVVMVAK